MLLDLFPLTLSLSPRGRGETIKSLHYNIVVIGCFMFNNRAFNIALFISFVWHFTCIAAVNIVVLPGKLKTREISYVSFLGPILALDTMGANKPAAVTPNYGGDLQSRRHVYDMEKEALSSLDIDRRDMSKRAEDKMNKVLAMPLAEAKSVPNIIRDSKKPIAKPSIVKESDISGPASAREIFYKPLKPVVPERISGSMPFNMELKFFVTAQGEVKEVIPVVSSGNAEIDLLGIRYLKGWKFMPAAEEEWGRIKIVLSKE